MKLSDIVCFSAIIPELESKDRNGAVRELVEILCREGRLDSLEPEKLTKAIIQRENEASTGMGKGVALPHIKVDGIDEPVAAVGRSSKGIDFRSLDKQPVYTILLLISPKENPDKHLQAMEILFRHLNQDDFRRFLRQAQTAEEIVEIIRDAD
ncbi:MAG TPA: PTS sugar transporter subunit IIA [Anaerohalosphaeraceae bacterium]|jgi:mannitol/fructose-specific phosphotransferase system IIA component (Ntr-type)|nr:PTS sugar transporter subunit IIA [Anaerohalosphaeraceae bacterium]HPB92347.1 PTS sugar transporter subunit IIA [Anaerohalosphaeraceae bacterium]HRT22960.1 PTS sugar transporter subunit IIA [Anaerohalosphaeraceae bacterium]HRU14648.1 PTS sugar transporter subunit IIA [Anaerohalosphaeraceae bacterium]